MTNSSTEEAAPTAPTGPAPNRVITALVLSFLLLELPLLTSAYRITVDEPWYSQVAWSLINGQGLYNHVVGVGGGDVFFLYTLVLGLFYKVFGMSLWVGRFLSVLCGVGAVVGVARILYALRLQWQLVALCTAAFIVSNISYLTFRVIRPEAICTVLGVWCIWFLLRHLQDHQPKMAALCGLFAGLGLLCHLNMAVFATAVGLVFVGDGIRRRRINSLLAYGVTASAALLLLPVVMEFGRHDGLAGVAQDLSVATDTRLTYGDTGILGFLNRAFLNATSFFTRLALGGKRLLIVVVEMTTLGAALFMYRRLGRSAALGFVVACFLGLALLFLNNFDVRAFTEVEWMIFVLFGVLIQQFAKSKAAPWKIRLALLAFGLLILNNLAGNLVLIKRGMSNAPYSQIEDRLADLVPKGSVVLSNQNFWFPLQDTHFFSKHSRWHKLDYHSLEALQQSGDLDYSIFLDRASLKTMVGIGKDTAWNESSKRLFEFRDAIENFSHEQGVLVDRFEVAGYGWINVWSFGPASRGDGGHQP